MKKAVAFLLVALAGAVWSPAWAYMPASSRGIYYGGKVHYVSVDDNFVFHTEGLVIEGNWMGPWENAPTATLPLKRGWKRQNPQEYGVGEATITLGALLVHYSVLIDASNVPRLCVSRYDLNLGVFLPDRNGELYPVEITAVTRNATGTYGVAATVFNDLIHVFTGEFTLTSADAMAYSWLPAIADGLSSYNARDAIAFYPDQSTQKVMVVFANPDKKVGRAGWVSWDGVASLPLASSNLRIFSNHFVGTAMLTMGTSGGILDEYGRSVFGPGAKVPTIQMVDTEPDGYQDSGFVYLHEYRVDNDTLTLKGDDGDNPDDIWHPYLYGPIKRLRVYPWYKTEYDPVDGRPILKQYIGINFYYCTASACTAHEWKSYALRSDTLVPQNHDDVGLYGWQGIPTYTNSGTDEELAVRKKYWSLLGVILGPPPFATNGMEQFEIQTFSNVQYGLDANNQVQHKTNWSDTVMVSSKTELKAGVKKLGSAGGVSASLEVGYKHGWEGSREIGEAKSVGLDFTAGTADETSGNWGKHGWAIFSSPTLLSQTHKIYAYDYDVQARTGTYLDMDLPTVVQAQAPTKDSPPPLTVNGYYFELDNPGGAGDQSEIAGLMSGMRAFPRSVDLDAWNAMTWEKTDAPWKVIYGTGLTGSSLVPTVSQGSGADIKFTNTTTNVETSGQTNSVDVAVGGTLKAGTKILGISEELTMGYDGEWSMETTNSTEVSNVILVKYHMPFMPTECEGSDCVTSLTVQPYMLQATDSSADWIPTAYGLNLPWCMTWKVTAGQYKDGRKIGEAAPPESAEGTVTGGGGAGPGAGSHAGSAYTLTGGHMGWLKPDGTTTPIPMGAAEFNPALGASVFFNGHEFRASRGLGTWKRRGETWVYTAYAAARADVFTLSLDFGRARWSFEGNRLNLADHVRAGDRSIRLELQVNGRYGFTCNVEHDVKIDWTLTAPSAGDGRLHLRNYSGSFNSNSGKGDVQVDGVLPSQLTGFGDLSLVLNGQETLIPFLALENFGDGFESGGVLTYQSDGIDAVVDFSSKTWSARIHKRAFREPMAPRWGGVRAGVNVGGASQYAGVHDVMSFTARLSFRGGR